MLVLMTPPITLNQLCVSKLSAARLAVAAVLLVFVGGSPGRAQAGTIPFTFAITANASVGGVPSPATLSLPSTVVGSGSFAPFGGAIYSEAGTITFVMLPSGAFVPSS